MNWFKNTMFIVIISYLIFPSSTLSAQHKIHHKHYHKHYIAHKTNFIEAWESTVIQASPQEEKELLESGPEMSIEEQENNGIILTIK